MLRLIPTCCLPCAVQCSPCLVRSGEDPLKLSNKDWEERMSPEQYYVCREKGTELVGTGVVIIDKRFTRATVQLKSKLRVNEYRM